MTRIHPDCNFSCTDKNSKKNLKFKKFKRTKKTQRQARDENINAQRGRREREPHLQPVKGRGMPHTPP